MEMSKFYFSFLELIIRFLTWILLITLHVLMDFHLLIGKIEFGKICMVYFFCMKERKKNNVGAIYSLLMRLILLREEIGFISCLQDCI